MNMRILSTAIVLVAIVAAFGCRKKEELPVVHSVATDTALAINARTDTSTATLPASPGGKSIVPSTAAGTTVIILLNDNTLAVQTTAIPPGPAVITVTNGGPSVHALSIQGPNVNQQTDNIPVGQNATMNVTFAAGTYKFFCPVLDHATKGESTTVTIQGK